MPGFASIAQALEPALLLVSGHPVATTSPVVAPPPLNEPARPNNNTTVSISLPVTLDGRYVGDIQVDFAGELVSFSSERLVQILQSDVTPNTTSALNASAIDGRLTPQAASVGGLRVQYDPSLQELKILTLLEARNRRILNTSPGEGVDTSATEVPEPVSLFLNAALSYSHIIESGSGSNRGRQPLSGTLEFGGRLFGNDGIAFITRQAYDEAAIHPLRRIESQLIYDDVANLIRVTAGDLRIRGTNLQALPRMAGVSIERFYGLEPTRVFRPIGQTSFDLERPSTVQVRINGLVFQELYLNSGRYDLRDLPLSQGSNNIELVIRDDTGREQIISQNNFFDFDLLAPGETDFSAAAGVRSETRNGIIRYSDQWLFSGFIRHGFSDTLTAGVDAQADRNGGAGGASVVWASPIGTWRLQTSASQRDGFGFGYAASAGYSNSGRFGTDWRWSLRADAQYVGKKFATVGDIAFLNGNVIDRAARKRLSASAQINNARLAFNLSGDFENIEGEGTRTSALLGLNYTVNSTLAVGVFGRHTKASGQSDTGLFFQINWTPGRNRLARATYDTARREAELNYRYSPQPYVGSTGYEVGIRRSGELDTAELTGRVTHVSNRFEASAQHNILTTADFGSQERVQVSRVTVASSLVLAGGKVSISRPVREAFAIVTRHATIAGKKVLIDRTENGVRSETDALGAAVVPDLPTYIRTSTYVDVEDLPLGYDLGTGQFSFKAPLYAGYAVEVGSAASVTMFGKVLNRAGEPISFVAGTMALKDKPGVEPIPVFTNRAGRLVGIGLTPGVYMLTLKTDPVYQQEVVIGENGQNLVDIGEIRVDQR